MYKFIFLIIVALSFKFSLQKDSQMPPEIKNLTDCIFSETKRYQALLEFIAEIAKSGNYINWITKALNLNVITQDCLGLNIADLIKKFLPVYQNINSKGVMLKKMKNLNAPVLLRKYIYDIYTESGIDEAKKECINMTKEKPYDKYNYICKLF